MTTWGIIPAAGIGSRIQPLAFSKELLPVGSRLANGLERPCAVSEYLVECMRLGGAQTIAFVISPTKSDIIEYFGGGLGDTRFAYVVQQQPGGLCDAIFQALPLLGDEPVLVGHPRPGIPVGRPGDTREVAAVVRFLCGPQAGYVTGASWLVDGGMTRMGPMAGSHLRSDDWRRP